MQYKAIDSIEYMYCTVELRTQNTKSSCFVYIDANTRIPSQNTKQTRQIGKCACNPRYFKYSYSPLSSRHSSIHFESIETLMIISSNSIFCYLLM